MSFSFDPANVDLPMFGDFATAAVTLMTHGFEGNLTLQRNVNGKSYRVSKTELTDVLGDLNDTENLALLKQFFETNEEDIEQSD